MPDSIFKDLPTVNFKDGRPSLDTSTTGVASSAPLAPTQPATEVTLKRVLAAAVAVAGALVPFLPAHTLLAKGLTIFVGLGAALGITSRGVLK